MTVAVDAKLAGRLVRKATGRLTYATGRGLIRGAMRARARLQRETPKDQGQAKASWRLEKSRMTTGARTLAGSGEIVLATWTNDAPYAGILENGARPHNVNPAGWQSIYRWVERHRNRFFVNRTDAKMRAEGKSGPVRESRPRTKQGEFGDFSGPDPRISEITNAIVRKIAREGQRPTYFVRNMIDELTQLAESETKASISEELRRGAP